jgi:hypothetical protein
LFVGRGRAVGAKANVLQSVGFVWWVVALLILPKRWRQLFINKCHSLNLTIIKVFKGILKRTLIKPLAALV